MKIIYNGNEYDGTVKFDGKLLELIVFAGNEKEEAFSFSIDSVSCTTSFMGLEKTEQTASLSDTFTPKIIFDFFSQTGAEFATELYNEELGLWTVSRKVGNASVCLELSQNEELYIVRIN